MSAATSVPNANLRANKYHLARRINHLIPASTNKSNLKEASQHYKRTLNFDINKFNRDSEEKLRNLKNNSPKDFWKLINNLERDKCNQNINLESLYTGWGGGGVTPYILYGTDVPLE